MRCFGGRLRSPERRENGECSKSSATISLSQEYALAIRSQSYNEIWSQIHHQNKEEDESEGADAASASAASPNAGLMIARVLQPDKLSIQNALRAVKPAHLTRVVSDYLDSSEQTSHLFLSIRRSIDRTRSLYAPITQVLDLIPPSHPSRLLSPPQCNWILDIFLEFNRLDNPFALRDADTFGAMRTCFAELRLQLDQQRRRHGNGACYHWLTSSALQLGRRRRVREGMGRMKDEASRGVYVLENHIATIECLVARMRVTVESDKVLVRFGMERGKGQRHCIVEVLRQLHKNHLSLLHQLRDLDEHLCLCLAAVNRARFLLLQHIHCHDS